MSPKELGAMARALRKDAQDTQEDAAGKLDVSQSVISRAEKGEQRYMGVCIRVIEMYSDFSVDYPVCQIKKSDP